MKNCALRDFWTLFCPWDLSFCSQAINILVHDFVLYAGDMIAGRLDEAMEKHKACNQESEGKVTRHVLVSC